MSEASADYQQIRYEMPGEGVARVVLARADTRNAQDKPMLYEINDALDRAMADDAVKVVIIAADGPHFSSGHHLKDKTKITDFGAVTGWGGFDLPGVEGYMSQEEEIYLGLCWRWRNLPKPTIAQVQGKVIAGGLMLVWPFDLIVAAEDATFSDPVVAFGVNGVEYFAHAFEVGPRKAKEMLFTGDSLTAEECRALGMVNHVVPVNELESFTLSLAEKVAQRPSWGLKLAKLSVNQSQDAQGFMQAMQAAFSLHHVGHANNKVVHGMLVDPTGADVIRNQAKAEIAKAKAAAKAVGGGDD